MVGSPTGPRKTRGALDRHWIYKYSRRRGAICPGHLASPRGLPDCNPITSHTLSLFASRPHPSRPLASTLRPLYPSLSPGPLLSPATPLSGRHWVLLQSWPSDDDCRANCARILPPASEIESDTTLSFLMSIHTCKTNINVHNSNILYVFWHVRNFFCIKTAYKNIIK